MQEKLKKIIAKKSVKEKRKIISTFIDVHMARQKVPKFDFQNHSPVLKISRIRLNFFIEESKTF